MTVKAAEATSTCAAVKICGAPILTVTLGSRVSILVKIRLGTVDMGRLDVNFYSFQIS